MYSIQYIDSSPNTIYCHTSKNHSSYCMPLVGDSAMWTCLQAATRKLTLVCVTADLHRSVKGTQTVTPKVFICKVSPKTRTVYVHQMYICIYKLSQWLTFWIYLTIQPILLDNSCTEKSYWMLHNARGDNCHGNRSCPLGDYVSNINL